MSTTEHTTQVTSPVNLEYCTARKKETAHVHALTQQQCAAWYSQYIQVFHAQKLLIHTSKQTILQLARQTAVANLEVGGDDFKRITEEVDPLNVRPRILHGRNELRALKLEEQVRVSVLYRAHKAENGAHQVPAHALGALALARA